MTTETEIHTDLTWTPEAWDTFQDIRNKAYNIGQHWGQPLGDRAIASVGICIMQTLASGPSHVYRDSPDGLLIVTPYITMGMIFHRDSAEYMSALLLPNHYAPEEIEACFKIAPPSGEWQLHS